MKTALVTGAGSGFGLLTSLALLKNGVQVIATMRTLRTEQEVRIEAEKIGKSDQLTILQMDVTSETDIERVRKYTEEHFQQLDILINNAGFCQGGFLADLDWEKWRQQMDVNVHGVFQVTKKLLPLMEGLERGHIVNISSVSGYIGLPGMSAYCTSKFAMEGFSESLRLELLPKNIYVTLIEPASYKTKIWDKGLAGIDRTNLESESFKKSVLTYAEKAAEDGADPKEVADLIADVCSKRKPKLRYPIGRGAKGLRMARQFIPWKWLEQLVIKKL